MIGIYKITSPSGKIYIGQSINIKNRKDKYRVIDKISIGPIIFNSLVKYGWINHQFEIIEECSLEVLNEREIFWKQHYINLHGWDRMLFCELYDTGGGPKSEYTKNKMSITHQEYLTRPEILLKRLKNCKISSTDLSKEKRNKNTNWIERNKKLKKPKIFYIKFEQFDLEGNLIKSYDKIEEIIKDFNGVRPQNLYSCLKGTYQTWMGYKWIGYK